ncbi:MAG: hypothetical protein R3B06_28870 [Kofleriaceae bacterium]
MRPFLVSPRLCRAALVALVVATASVAAADPPRDFTAEVQAMYRVVACGGQAALPAGVDAKLVDKHCQTLTPWYAELHGHYVDPATPFLAGLRPAGLPTTVVYPFGGGDLLSALITYPDATEITTISLEHAGDPTRVTAASPRQLKAALTTYRGAIRELISHHDSASENMRKLERGAVPGQLAFFVTALAALGYEPVGLRFFTIEPGGALHYLTAAEVAAAATKVAKRKRASWVDTDFSVAFTNSELTFRKAGVAGAPLIVHRHIAADLSDKPLAGSPVLAYLEARGKIATMTKAASYLLWMSSFSVIRGYLLEHMAWMISDSTGIPPRFAAKAGFTQTTYGRFDGSYLPASAKDNEAFRKLWSKQPRRPLPFRYGYPDSARHVHLMVTAPAP